MKAPAALVEEDALFERYVAGDEGSPSLRLCRQDQCLVTSLRVARSPGFDAAAARSAARGWPVHVRRSGGTTVFHGDNVLCATRFFAPGTPGNSIDAAYRFFTSWLIASLADVGVEASTGYAPFAPCDGQFNILVRDRKIAGTALRNRAVDGKAHFMGHASILLDADFTEGLQAVAALEQELGAGRAYPAGASIGLYEASGARGSSEQMRSALGDALARNL